MIGLSLFIACFAIGVGGTGWLIQGEMFPTAVRGQAASVAAFFECYSAAIEGSPCWPKGPSARKLLDLMLLEKVIYEIGYELANRPAWLSIPVQGLLDLLMEDGHGDPT